MQLMPKHVLPFGPTVFICWTRRECSLVFFAPEVFWFGDVSNAVLMCAQFCHVDKCTCMFSCSQCTIFISLACIFHFFFSYFASRVSMVAHWR
uniref:Uncharacterized protein n=1 Tax=Rhipicephalus zambeziensis TaxID=60191 RepID=A0A224YAP1_9ACAR